MRCSSWLQFLKTLSQLVFSLFGGALAHLLRLLLARLSFVLVPTVEGDDAHLPVDVAHDGREDPKEDEGDVHGSLGYGISILGIFDKVVTSSRISCVISIKLEPRSYIPDSEPPSSA